MTDGERLAEIIERRNGPGPIDRGGHPPRPRHVGPRMPGGLQPEVIIFAPTAGLPTPGYPGRVIL